MKLSDFRNLDTSNVGAWPQGVKFTFSALVVILIAVAGWYFKISEQKLELEMHARQELDLRRDFEIKQGRVVNLAAYRDQLAEMDEQFRQMLRQLPSRTEMPDLLTDISQTALAAGIDTQLFEPGPEVPRDFYAEKPITIRMVGSYHQFGQFISDLAMLPRVVILTMHDIVLQPSDSPGASRGARRGGAQSATPGGPLRMEGTVRTYRYLDEDEQAAQDAAAVAGAPGAAGGS